MLGLIVGLIAGFCCKKRLHGFAIATAYAFIVLFIGAVPILTYIGLGLAWLIKWYRKRKAIKYENAKPTWAIGFAIYYLADEIAYNIPYESMRKIVRASQVGLKDAQTDFHQNQKFLVLLNIYANALSEKFDITKPFFLALSKTVQIEAKAALLRATSGLNIDSYLKEQDRQDGDVNPSDENIRKARQKIIKSLQKSIHSDDDKWMICELMKHFLLRAFERYHDGESIFDFNAREAEKAEKIEVATLPKFQISQ